MLNEGPGDGGLGGHKKTTNETSVGHVIGSPEAPTTMGLIQSNLGALPGRLGALSPSLTLMFHYLHPTKNPC